MANWTAGLEALCRKIERNRYLLIFESKDLARLQDGRFSILEDVRHVTTSSGMSATISLGIGKDGGSFAENYRFASLAIEMSLSRGGDRPSSRTGSTSPSTAAAPKKRSGIRASNPA